MSIKASIKTAKTTASANPQFSLILSAGLLTLATGCKAETSDRVIRMEVQLGNVTAQPLKLPDGSTTDFPSVAKELFYLQVMNHDHFSIYVPPTAPGSGSTTTGGSSSSGTGSSSGSGSGSGAGSGTSTTGGSTAGTGTIKPPVHHAPTTASVSSTADLPGSMKNLGSDDLKILSNYGMLSRLLTTQAPTASALDTSTEAPSSAVAPSCVYDQPLIKLGTDVVAFEATFSAGIKVGYNSDGSMTANPLPVGGSVDLSESKMDLTVHWDDTLTQQPVVTSEGISYSTNVNFGIGAGKFPVGANFIYNTPLADVVKKAFTKGLDTAVTDYIAKSAGADKTWTDAWEGRILSDPSIDNVNYVAFRAGTYAGVMIGDKFLVTNQTYRWTDDSNPCKSALNYTIPDSTPIAEIEVVNQSNLITIAKVTHLGQGTITPGAKVKIESLYVAPTKDSSDSSSTSSSSGSAQ